MVLDCLGHCESHSLGQRLQQERGRQGTAAVFLAQALLFGEVHMGFVL